MHTYGLRKSMCAAFAVSMAVVAGLPAQTLTTLATFNGPDGAYPSDGASLVEGTNGNLFGVTSSGGTQNSNCYKSHCGVIFEITTAGALTTVHRFDDTDGYDPSRLALASDGNLFATTYYGGASGCGTIFKVIPGAIVYNFTGPEGCAPAGLVQGINGDFYGTALGGGSAFPGDTWGTIFKITADGTLTLLHSFSATDGSNPESALMQATDGNFYGTTVLGGPGSGAPNSGNGTVFKITPDGAFTNLHNFCTQVPCDDGYFPYSRLVQAADGNLYGTTYEGGKGALGTVFKITLAGAVTTLHNFCGQSNTCPDGRFPYGALVEATDGNLYGTTTEGGGPTECGTIFRITPGGTFTTLHSFSNTDGCAPYGGLVQGTDGNLYGTTYSASSGRGSVFSLSTGLGPFVKSLPHYGKVGGTIKILGTDLTGASMVSFNGVNATFTVISPTQISAAVPSGAVTGKIQVTTPGGTLSSAGPFQVLP